MLGAKVFSTVFFTLLMVSGVDIFVRWYRTFLRRRGVGSKLVLLLQRTTFVVLAFIFWQAVSSRVVTEEFASTHFFFALFIYCFYSLIASFFKGCSGEP